MVVKMSSHSERTLCPWLLPLVDNLMSDEGFGSTFPTIDNIRSSKASAYGIVDMCDCFSVHLPYAEETVTWLVCFDGFNPTLPPDFLFDLDTFEPNPLECEKYLAWDPEDPSMLTAVLLDFLTAYKHHQIELARRFDHLIVELDMLKESLEEFPESMDLLVASTGPNAGEAAFVFELNCYINDLPCEVLSLGPGFDTITLKITVPASGSKRDVIAELIMTDEFAMYLGKDGIRPERIAEDQMLDDYVDMVQNAILQQINRLTELHKAKKVFITTCLALYHHTADISMSGKLIEFDAENYRFIQWLRVLNDFTYIASVEFPDAGDGKPVLRLRSVYHEAISGNVLVRKFPLNDFDFKKPRLLVSQLWDFIKRQEGDFQRECLRLGK